MRGERVERRFVPAKLLGWIGLVLCVGARGMGGAQRDSEHGRLLAA